jgi:hypothetical protein|tara:strand:+ start:911 stop:1162 length:252 start_codon:yes stop_codon:yes gene_type:complete
VAKTKTVLLDNLSFDDMENISKFDANTLAAALVFVIVELIALDKDNTSVPAEELLSQASAHALDLLEGVHILTNDTTGEETLH